jgi:hypothetical protein
MIMRDYKAYSYPEQQRSLYPVLYAYCLFSGFIAVLRGYHCPFFSIYYLLIT